jgi:hypothetical protein
MAVNPWGPPEPPAAAPDGPPAAALHELPSTAPSHPRDVVVADTAAAAYAVVVVAAAIGRHLAGMGARGAWATGRRLVRWPPAAGLRLVAAVTDRAVPRAAREVLARLDVTALVRQYVDLDAIVAQVDLDRAVDRVDLERVIDRVDVERILDRVDLDAVVAKVDLDRAVDRVDLDRVFERADIIGLARYVVQEIDLPALVRYSTGSVTTEMVRGVRGQSVDADRAVERIVDRLLLRRAGRRAALPPEETGP